MAGPTMQRALIQAHRASAARLREELRSHLHASRQTRSARVSPLPASGDVLCVGIGASCYPTIQAALDAAHDGDTVRLGRGTFAGGVTITKSVRLVGDGASSTVIEGGGSVITIGEYGADVEPTVTISGVTISGGVARSSPESVPFIGQDGVLALGGGIEIPPNADFSGGADVTISDSVITDNRVAPTKTVPSGLATCPGGSCPFALASGGGIDSWGTLTLVRSTVSNNSVGAASGLSDLASDAEGAGIRSWIGPLTIQSSRISGNRASAVAPNGRSADSGGVFVDAGSFEMDRSSISGNSVVLAAALPDSVDLGAHAGGIHLAGGIEHASITDSAVTGNTVTMTNSIGYADAFSGGLHADIDVTASGVTIGNNTVTASGIDFASADSGAGEMGAAFSGAVISGNSVTATAANGWAIAAAGASIYRGSLDRSIVSDNRVSASSPNGGVWVVGGALMGDWGGITLDRSTVSRNTASGTGLEGSVQGGGIFDAVTDGPPGGPLNLTRTSVTWNTASGSAGVSVEGGGVYTDNVVTSIASVIAHNVPDQCVGC